MARGRMYRYSVILVIALLCLAAILFVAYGKRPSYPSVIDIDVEKATVTSAVQPETATITVTPTIIISITKPATATDTATLATNTSTPVAGGDTIVRAIVTTGVLNVRSGPGMAYGRIAVVIRDSELEVLGRYKNCQWLQISTPSGQVGWISAEYASYTWECSSVAEVEALPLSKRTVSPTRVPEQILPLVSIDRSKNLTSADTPTWTPTRVMMPIRPTPIRTTPTAKPTSTNMPRWTPTRRPLPTR